MDKIQKIKYSIQYFDVDEMKAGARRTIDLSLNGRLLIKDYAPGSRKARSEEQYQVESYEIKELYDSLRQCIDEAEDVFKYVDDVDAQLSIYHSFGRVETMPSGIGNEDGCTVGSRFLKKRKRPGTGPGRNG